MLAIIILIGLTLVLYPLLKKILDESPSSDKNNYLCLQKELDKLHQKNAELKEEVSALGKSATAIIALYDITKEICKSLELDGVFTSFKEQVNRYLRVADCRLLKGDADLSLYRNYTVLTLEIDKGILGYLAADIGQEQDRDKFHILAQQFILGVKRAVLYQKVQEIAITDGLTQTFTRRYCLERFQEEMERSRRLNYNLSFLIVDIDHFKSYNDQYGHLVGDAVLKEVAKIAKGNIRQIDFIGRYGGDEFAIILSETDKEQARFAAERLRQAVEDTQIKAYDEVLEVTISIGISTFPMDEDRDMQLLIDKADSALYRAKQTGRNKVLTYRQD